MFWLVVLVCVCVVAQYGTTVQGDNCATSAGMQFYSICNMYA